jgi:hypothetical protein
MTTFVQIFLTSRSTRFIGAETYSRGDRSLGKLAGYYKHRSQTSQSFQI